MSKFTHLNKKGEASMVDVAEKPVTDRTARAEALLRMAPETLTALQDQTLAKGDVLAVARIAGIQGAKQTSALIPLCSFAISLIRAAVTPRCLASALEERPRGIMNSSLSISPG